MNLVNKAHAVQSRQDLAAFVLELRENLLADDTEWENPPLERFLEALAAWCTDMPGYFHNLGRPQPQQPDWNLVAQMLLAASIYE